MVGDWTRCRWRAFLLAGVVLAFHANMARAGTSRAVLVVLLVGLLVGVGCIVWVAAVAVRGVGQSTVTMERSAVEGGGSTTGSAVSYVLCYGGCMAETITFRPDEDAARALAVLTRDGTPVSTAVRAALIEAARHRARTSLRAEAEALAVDEQDRAEAAQVLRDMETLRAWSGISAARASRFPGT
jgi:hypothetical protein